MIGLAGRDFHSHIVRIYVYTVCRLIAHQIMCIIIMSFFECECAITAIRNDNGLFPMQTHTHSNDPHPQPEIGVWRNFVWHVHGLPDQPKNRKLPTPPHRTLGCTQFSAAYSLTHRTCVMLKPRHRRIIFNTAPHTQRRRTLRDMVSGRGAVWYR